MSYAKGDSFFCFFFGRLCNQVSKDDNYRDRRLFPSVPRISEQKNNNHDLPDRKKEGDFPPPFLFSSELPRGKKLLRVVVWPIGFRLFLRKKERTFWQAGFSPFFLSLPKLKDNDGTSFRFGRCQRRMFLRLFGAFGLLNKTREKKIFNESFSWDGMGSHI